MDLEEKLGATVDERAFASVTKVPIWLALCAGGGNSLPLLQSQLIAKLIRVLLEAILLPLLDDRSKESLR